jgi:hypothetical protein
MAAAASRDGARTTTTPHAALATRSSSSTKPRGAIVDVAAGKTRGAGRGWATRVIKATF